LVRERKTVLDPATIKLTTTLAQLQTDFTEATRLFTNLAEPVAQDLPCLEGQALVGYSRYYTTHGVPESSIVALVMLQSQFDAMCLQVIETLQASRFVIRGDDIRELATHEVPISPTTYLTLAVKTNQKEDGMRFRNVRIPTVQMSPRVLTPLIMRVDLHLMAYHDANLHLLLLLPEKLFPGNNEGQRLAAKAELIRRHLCQFYGVAYLGHENDALHYGNVEEFINLIQYVSYRADANLKAVLMKLRIRLNAPDTLNGSHLVTPENYQELLTLMMELLSDTSTLSLKMIVLFHSRKLRSGCSVARCTTHAHHPYEQGTTFRHATVHSHLAPRQHHPSAYSSWPPHIYDVYRYTPDAAFEDFNFSSADSGTRLEGIPQQMISLLYTPVSATSRS
jgi:hypothetical protein